MKYVGSKNKLSKYLVPIIQSYVNDAKGYLEPFVGGCNIIDKIDCKIKVGRDSNKYLIALLNKFKEGYHAPDFISKDEYVKVKNNMHLYPDYYVGLIGFCATYNGGWMRRYGAIANTKVGKIRNYYQESVRNINKQIHNLQDVTLENSDFRDSVNDVDDYVIYCDIPYRNSKFEMYEDKFPYEEFYDWCERMSESNVVLISEYWMPEDRFECIWSKEHKTTFDNKNNNQDRIEKLFKVRRAR